VLGAGLDNSGNGRIRLPQDYQYDDAAPNDLIMATPLFGPRIDHAAVLKQQDAPNTPQKKKTTSDPHPGVESRVDFANWISSPGTPRFTTVIVNRLWKETFGLGLIEPVDDMRDDTKTPYPELLADLENMMRELRYDTKQFLRVLCNTQLYESSVVTRDIVHGQCFPGGGPMLRRMSAEQTWDSLLSLTVPDLDHRRAPDGSKLFQYAYDKYKGYTGTQLIDEIQKLTGSAYNDSMIKGNVMRALRPVFEREVGPQQDYFNLLVTRKMRLQDEIRRANKKGLSSEAKQLQRQYGQLDYDNPALFNRSFVRAAELESPAPPGHFIREFGGSDREQIDNAYDNATIPQVLTLLNGYVDPNLLANRKSVLWKHVEAAGTNNAKIEVIYKSLLSRSPSREEMTMATLDMRTNGQDALEDIVWVLVNSREFMFVL
ncbi:MAG: DUF1553 domain-containing protein, partial [Verrucomicrobia bacterium]|nr:DUF1553 domain-containing protein [Verrucomicrobiota bacterium]